MSIVTKNKAKAAQKLICLKKTRAINEDDLWLPEWDTLKKEYDAHQNGEWIDKAIVSLLNSAIFQRRVVFVLAKRSFRELAKSDKNWKKPIGLKDENWKTLIFEVINRDIVKCIHKTDKGRLVYEIIENDILKMINISVDEQRKEAIEFANELNDLDEGTTKGTTEGNRELEEELELEEERDKINEPINSFKEEEIEIDLDMTPPSESLKFLPPENNRIVAEPQITPEAILAHWKPQKVDSKDLDSTVANLFSTLKHYSIPKDELSTKKIIKAMFGPSPSKKIEWLLEKATQAIEEQRELIYAPDIKIQDAPIEKPNPSGNPSHLKRRDFDSDRAYELYYESLTSGRTVHTLGGSVAEYYNQRAYAESFATIVV